MTTTEVPKAAPETAAPDTTKSTNGVQPQGQGTVATAGDGKPAVDEAYSTFAYDNLPPAIWQHIRSGVETGAVPIAEVERWRADASERHRIEASLRRERSELLRAFREHPQTNGDKGTEPTKQSPTTPVGLRAKLGQEADQLEPTVVDAIEAYVNERLQAVTVQQPVAPQPAQVTRDQVLARQMARLGERFPGLKDAQRAPDLIQEVESWVFSLAKTADPRLAVGANVEERMDRLFDAAGELAARDNPYLRQGPRIAPTPPAVRSDAPAPKPSDTGIGSTRSTPLADMTFEQRQVAAAQWVIKNPGRDREARELFGLPS